MGQLSEALFTTTQQQVLGLLYAWPEKSFYTNEILRTTGMGVATIKRELDRMLAAGILTMKVIGNQHHYQANPDCPIYKELRGIVQKTLGAGDLMLQALESFSENIDWAFIFGSYASGKETSASDIDLMIVGEVGFSDVAKKLYSFQEKVGREINPKIYSKADWIQLQLSKDGFVKEVLTKPKINIIGDGNGLR